MLSGIAPLDQRLGTLAEGRPILLTGGPGTGKTTACLHFLRTGLQTDDTVALLTSDRCTDLDSHARSIGFDIAPPLRSERLIVLRYRAGLDHVPPDRVIEDLARLLDRPRPVRIAIDPLTPFLAGGAAGAPLAALAHFIDKLGATTILTHSADMSNGFDARLDPIVQHAAAIVHFTRGTGADFRMRVLQNRTSHTPATTTRFAFRPGRGLVLVGGRTRAEPALYAVARPAVGVDGTRVEAGEVLVRGRRSRRARDANPIETTGR
jgi:KaiC/GvpD/RAD55 family RecA-like ATPase